MTDPKSPQPKGQATQAGIKVEAATAVSQPTPGGDANVVVMMPSMDKGFLCRANGNVSVPAGESLEGVYLKVVKGKAPGTVLPTDQEVIDGYDKLSRNATWNFDGLLPAWAGPNATKVDNTLCAVKRTQKFVMTPTPHFEPFIDRENVPFKGVQVTSCPPMAIAAATAAPVAASPIPTPVDASERHPTDRDGDWLLYRGLSVAMPGMGNVLMLDGKPLRARVAAFAATNVLWQHSIEFPMGMVWSSGVVRRAVGELIPADDTIIAGIPRYFSPGAPKYSVLVTQQTASKPFVHVMASECRERPDFVHLDPTEDIRVQVNFDIFENVRTGEFDLWVKVVTG
ncbi:MAG: hypothetical protein AABP62_01175 [Planctomycetota bacterium]